MLVAKNCYLEKHPFGETSISKTENAVFIASLTLSLSRGQIRPSHRSACGTAPETKETVSIHLRIGLVTLKKDLYRREGKGRRCCLGDRIDSIPCRTSYS